MPDYHFHQCLNPTCRFRFPAVQTDHNCNCPKCGKPARRIEKVEENLPLQPGIHAQGELEVLADNIRSAYNIGSIFRTADSAGVSKITLSGISPTPLQAKVAKTALGAENWVSWEQSWNAFETCQAKQQNGFQILVLEKTVTAAPLFQLQKQDLRSKILMVIGNENEGIDPQIRLLADEIRFIPMYGNKESLNVSVAFGIAVYWIRNILNASEESKAFMEVADIPS